jgi:hypothetical protein
MVRALIRLGKVRGASLQSDGNTIDAFPELSFYSKTLYIE